MSFCKRLFSRKNIASLTVVSSVAAALFAGAMPKVNADRDYYSLINISYATQEELDEKKAERDRALSQAEAASQRADEINEQKDAIEGELSALNKLTEEERLQYELLSSQYSMALLEKARALDDYIAAQENLEATQKRFSERLSIMFEYQNKSTLEILLESDSIAGFFTNIELIGLIADADDQAVDEMQIALDDARLKADNALAHAEEMEKAADDKMAELSELEQQAGLKKNTLAELTEQLEEANAEESSFRDRADALNGDIERLQNELYTQITPVPSNPENTESGQEKPMPLVIEPTDEPTAEPTEPSDPTDPTESTDNTDPTDPTDPTEMYIPTEYPTPTTAEPVTTPTPIPTTPPSSNTTGELSWPTWSRKINSPYGYRIHPIYGDQRLHAGIDIDNGYGDAICAAAAGTVSVVEEPVEGQNTGGSGYGNYVIIDHGNGLYTLYGHCRDVYVSQGEYVSAGQQIAEVGSTGGSEGPHLHFEVRTGGPWGETHDPMGYLP